MSGSNLGALPVARRTAKGGPMGENHTVTGPARGEPQPAGREGACIRIPLDASPSPRWSRALASHLATGLAGHPAVGHLRLDCLVQGSEIVLEGVEPREADLLGPVLRDAIGAANAVCERIDGQPSGPVNMEPARAQDVARAVSSAITP